MKKRELIPKNLLIGLVLLVFSIISIWLAATGNGHLGGLSGHREISSSFFYLCGILTGFLSFIFLKNSTRRRY